MKLDIGRRGLRVVESPADIGLAVQEVLAQTASGLSDLFVTLGIKISMIFLRSAILMLAFGVAVQTQSVIFRGEVADPNGAVIPGANVELMGKDLIIVGTKTDSDGMFNFSIPNGVYAIKVSKTCFKDVINDYSIPNDKKSDFKVSLEVGGCEIIDEFGGTQDLIEVPVSSVSTKIYFRL
ncbi:MAG: carboxypeptidase-like regulatory domain-containing protein [Pyrinomonadaceae bacterium]